MPHQLTQFREELGTDVKESDYPSYATFLQDMVELYYASFREAKLFIQMKVHVKLHSKLKDASKIQWLKPGRLVLVFSPSDVTDDNFRTSAKLVFQFTGPLRIVKVHRNAVHLQYLDGTPHTTRSIKHVFPYNREHDELLQAVDKYTLTPGEQAEATGFKQGDMCIATTRQDGRKLFILGLIVRKIDDLNFEVHCWNTYDSKKRLGLRVYAPDLTRTPKERNGSLRSRIILGLLI